MIRRLWRALIVLVVVARRFRPSRTPAPPSGEANLEEGATFDRETGASAAAERLVAALLFGSAVAFVAFAALVIGNGDTQWLGVAMALGLGLMGAALGVTAKRVAPREKAIERRPELADPQAGEAVRERLAITVEGVSRRRLLGAAGLTAGGALAAALAAPVTAIGPSVGESIVATPWRRGRRLVDEQGVPLTADDVPESSFVTAFPEGADRRELGSPVVLVREDPSTLRLPAGREDWAPEGILGFSKICTHAGCAIALYRQPLHEPTSLPPGLGCPCHYSVFDTRRGGSVVAGPAGRALPQLPLVIGPGRELRAGGGFSGPIGPSWWGVRKT